MYRFILSDELSKVNFVDNSTWFGIKLYVTCNGTMLTSNKQCIKDQTYRKSIEAACKRLQIESSKFSHIGRSVGPIDLELSGIPANEIDELGNWNPSVQKTVYSAKMPLRAMKVAAGYTKNEKYWNPRTSIEYHFR